jgi:tRNA pseudouridine38-40 synthase
MHTYKLTIAYDGTCYSGWQIQPNATSIQEIIQKALSTFTKEKISLIGSGRTDAGVHAVGQVAHFRSTQKFDPEKLLKALNGMLPVDIRILKVEEEKNSFHAQKSAQSKIYHYHITLDSFIMPCERLYTTHIRKQIDIDLLERCAKEFIGTHDFTSFANKASEGAASKNAVRTITRLDVIKTKHGIRLEFEGTGFLYKMVRNIVGMLLAVASHKRKIEEVKLLFKVKDRRQAPLSAPASGLFLIRVIYE